MKYIVEVMVKAKWERGEWYVTRVEVEADSFEEAGNLGVAKVKEWYTNRGWHRDETFSCRRVWERDETAFGIDLDGKF